VSKRPATYGLVTSDCQCHHFSFIWGRGNFGSMEGEGGGASLCDGLKFGRGRKGGKGDPPCQGGRSATRSSAWGVVAFDSEKNECGSRRGKNISRSNGKGKRGGGKKVEKTKRIRKILTS